MRSVLKTFNDLFWCCVFEKCNNDSLGILISTLITLGMGVGYNHNSMKDKG